jgi:type I restriction enzyme S subunit
LEGVRAGIFSKVEQMITRSEWHKCTWGDIATLEYGKGLREYGAGTDATYPVYGTNGLIGWHSEPLFHGPGVIIGRKGAYRGVHYSQKPFFVIDTAFYLKPKEEIDLRWAYYQLCTQDINGMDSGSAIPSTSRSDFYHLPVTVPPLAEQQAIAATLGALDDKIELNRRMNQTLEELGRTLFRAWFVDFVPVRAKREGRAPDGIDAETAALFPAEFEDSAMGPIPKGWRLTTVGEVAKINAWSLSKNDMLEKIEYIEISEVSRGEVGHIPVYTRGKEPGRARRRLRHGDTVLSTVRPDREAYFLALDPPETLIASTGFAVISPEDVPWSFLHPLLTMPEIFQCLGHLAEGGAYPAVSPRVVSEIEFALPSRQILTAFAQMVAPLYEKMSANRQESSKLTSLRDALLPELMSGEIRVQAVYEESKATQ